MKTALHIASILVDPQHVLLVAQCVYSSLCIEGLNIQSVPLVTEPGISLIILILSGSKWWPLPAHVMISSHFLHNEIIPLQISLQYPH